MLTDEQLDDLRRSPRQATVTDVEDLCSEVDRLRAHVQEHRASTFADIERVLESVRCPDCGGRGKRDDGEPGDSYYNEWDCESCAGTGVRARARITLQVTQG